MLGASLKLLVFSVWLFALVFLAGLAGLSLPMGLVLLLLAVAGGSLLLAGLTNVLGIARLLFKKWD